MGAGLITMKMDVREFWERASCGEDLYLCGDSAADYQAQTAERYRLEPYIFDCARFDEGRDKDVLEVGVGLGADHQQWAESGARLTGIDLTARAVQHTRLRLAMFGLASTLKVADAEALPFADDSFDIVYSWGVIHHSVHTDQAASEILRVLRPGGRFTVMIYHKWSLVGLMLWGRYGLMRGRPFARLEQLYAQYLESPGTKAFTADEGAALFAGAKDVATRTILTHGDLLEGHAGQRHNGMVLSMARALWPRPLLRRTLQRFGLFLVIEGKKAG